MKATLRCVFAAALAAAAVLAPSAAGTPAADLTAMTRDYARDQRLTPCRFTRGQLEAARKQISEDIGAYARGLPAAIAREIKRWKDRACAGKRGGAKLRIVAVKASGGANAESVAIRNVGSKTVNLRGYALRDGTDHTLRLGATKLRKGRTLRVVTGCRRGHKGALRRGSRYYACRTTAFWDDTGDLVELLGPGGGLLSQKRY